MKTDIEIAQEAVLDNIVHLAEIFCVQAYDLDMY